MEANPFDQALAELLGDDAAELRDRLLAGEASAADRREARGYLDDVALRRFDLAHPALPREQAREVDIGEVQIDVADLENSKAWKAGAELIRDRLVDELDDSRRGAELVADVRIRLLSPGDDESP